MIRLLTVALVSLCCASAHAAPTEAEARARTEALVAAFVAVQQAPTGGSLPADAIAANAKAYATLDGFLHRRSLLDGALGPHAKSFSAEQRARFDATFWALLRAIAYPDSGAFFRTAERSITGVKADADVMQVTLHARVVADDLETDITLVWRSHEGALKLVDVMFDGASLLTDYQNQFGRIIAKKGVDGLLKTLAERQTKLSGPMP